MCNLEQEMNFDKKVNIEFISSNPINLRLKILYFRRPGI